MSKNLLSKLKYCLSKYKSKERYKKILTALAIAVVLTTCYILMEPAITMEKILICLSNSHEHIDDCYGTESEKEKITYLINQINNLPTVEEMNNHINELSNNGATEAEIDEYKNEILGKAQDAYNYYLGLNTKLQNLITNIDKLLEYVDAELIDVSNYTTTVASLDNYEEYGISTLSVDNDTPTTVSAVSTSEFIELNLYDYKGNINTKYNGTDGNKEYPGFQWNGGAYLKTTTFDRHTVDYIDFGNSLISNFSYGSSTSTNGKSSNAVKVGNQGGAINALDVSDYGVTNRPIGMSLGTSITDTSEDVLSRTLGSDGYPELAASSLTDKSLAYLFTDGTYAEKKNTANIDGLFQQDEESGEYFYNSRWNHAQYSADNNKFTLYNQIITPNFIVYPFGNFLPFNKITNTSTSTQVSKITNIGDYIEQTIADLKASTSYNATRKQLVAMLQMYYNDLDADDNASTSWSAKKAIQDYFTGDGDNPSDDTSLITNALLEKMYNIDWDVKTNFFFGMEMKMNFMQPKDGMTGKDNNQDGESDYPMEFYFTGDDDVWVYIDDVLFLDLSGIHRHVGGKIDFVNGTVSYYYLDSSGTGDVSSETDPEDPYQTYTFEEILEAAGKSTDGLNSNGTFKDYTTHSFKFYYLERGSGSSVCRLEFNFPLLKQNSINVSKDLSVDTGNIDYLGNPDFKFQVLKANEDVSKTNTLFITAGTPYTVYDADDNVVRTDVTDANGVFTLKAGQRAEFTGIEENSGKYYVRELLSDDITQYGEVTVSGETATTSLNVTVGSDNFTGLDSPVKDMSDGSTIFKFNNEIDTYKYGSIEITKILEGDNTDNTFDFEVTLDSTKLPVGTKYTVGGIEKTVSVAGIVSIKPGEVATINKILAGTAYEVKEVNLVANDYTIKYNGVETDEISGNISVDTKVSIEVTNIANEGELNIPITKVIANPYSEAISYSYQFKITEIDENLEEVASDNIVEDTITINITSTKNGEDIIALNSGEFVLKYDRPNYNSEGITYYYKIEEIPKEDDNTKYDNNYYIIKVVVTRDSTGVFSAKVTEVYYNGFDDDHKITETESGIVTNQFTFTNHLLTDLTISKEVHYNGDITQSFNFELQVTYDENLDGTNEPITGVYICEKGEVGVLKQITFEEQGIPSLIEETTTTDECNVTFNENGITEITLLHNEYISIYGLPYGSTYKVTELTTDGYIVENQINSGNIYVGSEANGTLVNDTDINNTVKFINSSGYILPDTGSFGMLILIIIGALLFGLPIIYIGYTFYKRRKKVT